MGRGHQAREQPPGSCGGDEVMTSTSTPLRRGTGGIGPWRSLRSSSPASVSCHCSSSSRRRPSPVSASPPAGLPSRVGELLSNTVSLVLVTTTACVVVGVGAAWLVERTELPAARWWRLALVAPLAVPAFVNAYAWVSLRPSLTGLGGRPSSRHCPPPLRLPSGRGVVARARQSVGGQRPLAQGWAPGDLSPDRSPTGASGPARRGAARGPAPARRVRRAGHAALPHLHDGDPRPV